MVTLGMSHGQNQQWTWMHVMNREPGRWVVVGDLLQAGAETWVAVEEPLRELLAEYELDSWVLEPCSTGSPRLRRTTFDIPVEWTGLRGKPQWAVHVVHTKFTNGAARIDVRRQPIRLFGYTRDDGRVSVVAAISHLFADGAGLKGLARELSSRVHLGQPPRKVASLAEVLAAQSGSIGRTDPTPTTEMNRFERYYASAIWSSLSVRESGEVVFMHPDGASLLERGTMSATGNIVAALGMAWRRCIDVSEQLAVPMTLLHRHASPIAARPYMGPGDVSVLTDAPSTKTFTPATLSSIWRSLINQSRSVDHSAAHPGTPEWTLEQDRYKRTLRLNVRAAAGELSRDEPRRGLRYKSSEAPDEQRAYADVLFSESFMRIRWDLPRAKAACSPSDTFGQVAVQRFIDMHREAAR